MEEFLLRAKIVSTRDAGDGITGSRRATLSDDALTHDAHIQTIDQSTAFFRPPTGPPEFNFKDSYRYNVAAYRLAALLELDNVPMSVERTVNTNRSGRKRAAVTWWIDDVMMDERARRKTAARGPDPARTAMQTYIMRVFDELIANRDRNLGNLLWTTDWKMWMIDHTRAFKVFGDLKNEKDLPARCEKHALDALRGLDRPTLEKSMEGLLNEKQIDGLLARRDAIVSFYDDAIEAYEKVVELDPESIDDYLYLAILYDRTKDEEKAKDNIIRFLENGGNGEDGNLKAWIDRLLGDEDGD